MLVLPYGIHQDNSYSAAHLGATTGNHSLKSLLDSKQKPAETPSVSSKDPNNDAFKRRGWDQLAGKSRRYIFAAFIYFNYQEMALAAFGLCYGILIHTLF